MRSNRARRALLAATALVFLGVAVGSLLAPHEMAAGLGYRLDNVDALNEFRAVYVGMWLAMAAVLGWAFRRIEEPCFGDVAALLLLGQTVGRLISLVLDGGPSGRIWPMLVLEGLGGIALLWVRPTAKAERAGRDAGQGGPS